MAELKIDYVEFASSDVAGSTAFLAQAFGWGFLDYGPGYQAFADAGLDGGIDGSGEAPVGSALVILKTGDLDGALSRVLAAGGVVTKPIFSFPGGRRFHFRAPGGVEMGVSAEV